jgi:hypothetical protein
MSARDQAADKGAGVTGAEGLLPSPLSAMVSTCQPLVSRLTPLLTGLMSVLLCSCSGGDGVRADGAAPPGPSPAAQRAAETSTTSDIDRILAENPGNPNAEEIKALRGDVAEEEDAYDSRTTLPQVDRYESHDRRKRIRNGDQSDQIKLEGAVDSHDRFADDRAAQARQELTWMPMRVDL